MHAAVLRRLVLAIAMVAPGWSAGAALGVTVPTPLTPAAGEAVLLTPPAGFANGDVNFTWSIVYDCPGSASIHSSYIERRQPADAAWQAEQRGGPFLGDGQFTLPATFFPVARPAAWEWRVFWACGATLDFAGAQGTSVPVPFTVALPGVAKPPCADLTGSALVICRSKRARDARLAACAKRPTAKKRAACRVRARALHRRTVRIEGCKTKTGKAKAACIRAANDAYRQAIS